MKIHLIIFGICCILCFGVCQEQKDAKIDSIQQQTAQINAYSTNKLVTPLKEITDKELLQQTQKIQKIITVWNSIRLLFFVFFEFVAKVPYQ